MQLNEEEVWQLDNQGYLIVRNVGTPEQVEKMVAALKLYEGCRAEEFPANAYPAYFYPDSSDFRIMNFLECDPIFLETVDHPEILRVVDSVVKYPSRLILPSSITRTKGPGNPLHQDKIANTRFKQGRTMTDFLTCIISLSDCGPEDGPLVVIEGSHKLTSGFPYNKFHPDWNVDYGDGLLHKAAKINDKEIQCRWEDIPGYKELHVKAGDLIFFVEDLVHGAKAIKSDRTRRTLNLMYGPYRDCNLNGIEYSEELILRGNKRQRELLQGPFSGFRFENLDFSKYPPAYLFRHMPNKENFVWKKDDEV